MFGLIITVISIALVGALVGAAMYYGGTDTLTKGKQEAEASKAINEMNQIRTAILAYRASEGRAPTTFGDISPKYIRDIPESWRDTDNPIELSAQSLTSRQISGAEDVARKTCERINERFNLVSTPLCENVTPGFMGCCEIP